RGETGFTDQGTQPGTQALLPDTGAVWLHNFIWSQLNPGGMLESYWYSSYDPYGHIYNQSFDYRHLYGPYYQFIKGIPLNNGHYIDAGAVPDNPALRVWGQKDMLNGRAHLWIANRDHTWQNVVSGTPLRSITSTIMLSGMPPSATYNLE